MTRHLTISSAAFEGLVSRLPAYVDVVLTADETHKYMQLDSVTYKAPLEDVA